MNNALKKTIARISEDFFVEAKSSPRLLEDIAAMERYMAESYSGRIFIELLQNADDAQSSKICLRSKNKHLYFANNGRCFEEKDVIAISRSGSSNKEKGATIGYRGIGFKSTTHLTDDIIIYSDETYFTFSKVESAKLLNLPVEKTPTIRIPLPLVRIDEDIANEIRSLIAEGYTTVFVFKNAKVSDFRLEIDEIEYGYFLFLNHIERCSVQVDGLQREFCIDRYRRGLNSYITIDTEKKQTWLIRSSGNTSVAFKYENNNIVPCSDTDARYHCYLPTIDTTPYYCKINGDFSTDPSRKHLVFDDSTKAVLREAAAIIFEVLCMAINNPLGSPYYKIVDILSNQTAFSLPNAEINKVIDNLIVGNHWLQLNNRQTISATDYKQLPDWLENFEKMYLRENAFLIQQVSFQSEAYKNIPNFEVFFAKYSQTKFSLQDFVKVMGDKSFVSNLSSIFCAKIIVNLIKEARISSFIRREIFDWDDVYIKTADQTISIAEVRNEPKLRIAPEISEYMSEQLSREEADWFVQTTEVGAAQLLTGSKPRMHTEAGRQKKLRLSVKKWRTAEEQCVDIETSLNYYATDVSKQNLGYDVVSTTKDGIKRYIEVKSVSAGGEFCMTNNEYTAAHQYGDQYYLCLIEEVGNSIKATYIQNPLKSASFVKRVRQWEWLCTKYHGEEFQFDISEDSL